VKLLDLPTYEKGKNPSQNNPSNSGSAWQFLLPVGLIIIGLMAIISLLIMKENKNKKKLKFNEEY